MLLHYINQSIDQLFFACVHAAEPDPPDEVFERVSPISAGSVITNVPLLYTLVSSVKSDGAYRSRTLAAIVCVVIVSILNIVGGYVVSYVMAMFLLDCTLFIWITLRANTRQHKFTASPLGWLGMAGPILSFVHPLLPRIYENTCLCLMLLAVVLRDILFVVFCSVIFVSAVQNIYILG